jgi:hypothetical protein
MFVKKLGIAAVLLSIGISTAYAHTTHHHSEKFYFGGDIQGNKFGVKSPVKNAFSPNSFKTDLAGASLFVGYKCENLGAELGYTWFRRVNYKGTMTTRPSGVVVTNNSNLFKQLNNNIYLDGIYYYPMNDMLDLKASLGVGALNSKLKGNAVTINTSGTSLPVAGTTKSSKVGIRAGIGAEVYFAECLSSSLMFRYQTGNKIFKDVKTVALSLAYHL